MWPERKGKWLRERMSNSLKVTVPWLLIGLLMSSAIEPHLENSFTVLTPTAVWCWKIEREEYLYLIFGAYKSTRIRVWINNIQYEVAYSQHNPMHIYADVSSEKPASSWVGSKTFALKLITSLSPSLSLCPSSHLTHPLDPSWTGISTLATMVWILNRKQAKLFPNHALRQQFNTREYF